MKKYLITVAALALAVPLAPAFAADPPKQEDNSLTEAWKSFKQGAYEAWTSTVNAFDEMTRKSQQDVVVATALPGALSGKQLIGTPIENKKEGRVGSIADLVLGNDSRVDAIIVSDGGFLGLANGQIPVKPGLISIRKDKDGSLHAQTNVTEAQLDHAYNASFPTRVEAMNDNFKKTNVKTVSRLIGATVVGPDNKSVATVNDVLLSPVGQAQYALLNVGGAMGVGSKQVAVKASSLTFTTSDQPLKIAMTADQLKALAPVRSSAQQAAAKN